MGIRIVAPKNKQLQAGGAGPAVTRTAADGYFDRIVKYIPSQVITFYTAAVVWLANPGKTTTGGPAAAPEVAAPNAAATVPAGPAAASGPELWVAFAAGLGLTIFLTYWQTREPGKPPAYSHLTISTLAFVVWAYATGGPFVGTGWWQPGYAAFVLAIFVIIIGTIAPQPDQTNAAPNQAPVAPGAQ